MVQRKTLELWVGAFVAAGAAALVMLAFKVGNLTTNDTGNAFKVRAYFENIGGLKVKSAVTMAGVRVGRVSKITFDEARFQALVIMDIDGRYDKIPADTSASILTSGLLGEQYVGMEPGGADEVLKEGDTLQITQSAMVLEKLIGQFLFSKAAEGDAGKPTPAPKR
jgi:phospholipid/cholesterol/gamma-HCH transport system substrate-binding protein